jgi:hypothetical protein
MQFESNLQSLSLLTKLLSKLLSKLSPKPSDISVINSLRFASLFDSFRDVESQSLLSFSLSSRPVTDFFIFSAGLIQFSFRPAVSGRASGELYGVFPGMQVVRA